MTITADARQAFSSRARVSMRALKGQSPPTAEVVRIIVKGAWARVSFTWLLAVLGAVVLPLTFTLGYAAFITAWEFALRPLLDQRIALALARRSERAGIVALAAISFIGGF